MIPVHLLRALERDLVPFTAYIELTRRCNWSCRHCFIHGESGFGGRELGTAEALDALVRLRELGTLFLSITGGEPTLRADLPAIVRRARELEMAVMMMSNASLIDEKMAAELAGAGLYEVQVSILGSNPETHDGLSGVKGSCEAAWRGVRALKRSNVHVIVKTPLMRQNFDEVGAIHRQASDLGLHHIFSPVLFPRHRDDRAIEEMRLDDGQMADAMRLWQGLNEGQEPPEGVDAERPALRRPCKAGVTSMVVGATGEVLPCPGSHLSAGSIRSASLKTVWREAELFGRLRGIRVPDEYALPGAKTAIQNFFCPILSHLETGDLARQSREAERFNRILARTVDEGPVREMDCGH